MSLSIVITVYDDWNNINDIISMSLCTSMPPFTFSVFGRRCKMTITDSCLLLLFIGPESDHWLPLSLTHSLPNWLTNCCLVDLMALNDANCLMMSQQLGRIGKSSRSSNHPSKVAKRFYLNSNTMVATTNTYNTATDWCFRNLRMWLWLLAENLPGLPDNIRSLVLSIFLLFLPLVIFLLVPVLVIFVLVLVLVSQYLSWSLWYLFVLFFFVIIFSKCSISPLFLWPWLWLSSWSPIRM